MKEIDRKVEAEILAEELAQMLKESPQTDSARFVQKLLEVGPEIGGVLTAAAGASGVGGALLAAVTAIPGAVMSGKRDKGQEEAIRLLLLLARSTISRLDDAEQRLVSVRSPDQLVAGRVTFNPNAGSLSLEKCENVSSVTDNGHLDFTINFRTPIWPYTVVYSGSGQVTVLENSLSKDSLRIRLAEDAPERVAVLILV